MNDKYHKLVVNIDHETMRKLKIIAAKKNTTVSDIIRDLIDKKLAETKTAAARE
jgi:plasmid stability protein